jgi:hypothetical protein
MNFAIFLSSAMMLIIVTYFIVGGWALGVIGPPYTDQVFREAQMVAIVAMFIEGAMACAISGRFVK